MRDLEQVRRKAHVIVGSTMFDLRQAGARLAATDIKAGLHLAQLATRVGRELAGLQDGPASPGAPDPWLLAAARLHDRVSDAADATIDLLMEVEEGRRAVIPPEAAQVHEDDAVLFGFVPDGSPFEGWTDPQASWDLGRLALASGSVAERRRSCVVAAVALWCHEHQAEVEAAGTLTLRECCQGLHRVQVEIRETMREVRPGTVAGARAAARVAARSLVELGEDPADLIEIVRAYAATLDHDEPASLAWSAVEGLLATAGEG
jgi:hypothetical protein